MPLVQPRTDHDDTYAVATAAGTTAVYINIPKPGYLVSVTGAPLTTQASTVSIAVNGGSALSTTLSLVTAFTGVEADFAQLGTGAVYLNAGDTLSFTGTGAAGAAYSCVVRGIN